MLSGKRIVLGVTGGIAAYRAAELVEPVEKGRRRGARGDDGTRLPLPRPPDAGNAQRAIRVHTDLFAARDEIAHIALAKWADLFVVAPATANIAGQVRRRNRRRPALHHVSGHALPRAAGPGDERRHVEAPRHAEKR